MASENEKVIVTVDTHQPASVTSWLDLIRREAHFYGFVDVDSVDVRMVIKLSGLERTNAAGLMQRLGDLWVDAQVEVVGAKPTATFIKDVPTRRDTAKLYRVSPPLIQRCYCCDHVEAKYDYVVTSTWVNTHADLGERQEVLIFGANADGEILSLSELDGSYRGGIDHGKALRKAGYEVVA